ncbi:glycoside hydrolase family 3 N-terminal domain-containing protein [Nocardioides sambongensis]|uniref:glycoside hydrolase family 3 N-terminal domain-containing protein n=1 Tax=Nocardioides sambongensis TaxID=2589074 RepID=UPI0011276AD1|nr:glycoside hydrolase family 3 N-terminal domain-containing protein [Nocardioides sambongensis]
MSVSVNPRPTAPEDAAGVERLALQVQLASFEGPRLAPEWSALLAEGLGGICLFGSNLTGDRDDVADLVADIRRVRPAALVGLDEEGGDVTRLHIRAASPVPGAAVLGRIDDADLTASVGRAVGTDLASVGIDLDLGPVADVNSNPDNPVIGTRSFAGDPAVAGRHVAAWVRGLQSAGVAACVKHFPGHGDTAQDSHLMLPVLEAEVAVLERRELPPFAAAIAAGAATVMTSHLVVPVLDDALPATFSAAILGRLRTMGFEGAIVSDALDMAGASAGRGIPAAAVLSLAAGADLLCIGPDKPAALVREVQAAIVAAVEDGSLPLQRLRDAAARTAAVQDRAGHPAGTPGEPVTAERLRAATRTAFDLEGALPDLTGARVLSLETEANIAVGPGRWGVDPDLRVDPADAGLPDGPLVVQVRDAHRRTDVSAVLARLAERDEPALVVEWGWPGPRTGWDTPAGAHLARLCTWGNSRPAIEAVEEMLREAGWRR